MRRDGNGELLGFVEPDADGRWRALTVFGAELTTAPDRDGAVAEIEAIGLGVLAERWWYRDGEEWLPAAIQEASPGRVVAVVGDGAWSVNAIGGPNTAVTLTGAAAAALRRRPA